MGDTVTHPATLTRAFLFCDLRGYTAFVERHGDAAAANLLDRYRRLVREAVSVFSGAEIRTEGDSFYVVFESTAAAVRCGLAIVESASEAAPGETRINIGVGIHAGEAVDAAEGLVGSAVNIAARVCAIAQPGEVLVTDTVRGLVRTSIVATFLPRGNRRLKGIAEPVALYGVTAGLDTRRRRTQTAAIGRRGLVAGVAAAALTLGGLALAFARPGLPTASFASSLAPTLPSTSSGVVGGVEPRGILAFLSTQQVGADPFPRRQVYTVNPDGTNRRLRSRLTDNVRWFAWEPGGRRLAYAGEALGPQIVDLASDGQPRPWPGTWNQDRVVINGLGPAPSSDEQIPANELRIGDLQWLPDGKALVVTNRGVGFLAADGTSFRPMPGLVSADEAARNVSADELRIARDGQTIVYRRLAADGGFDLWVTSVAGGRGIQVTSRVEAFDPTWSPDGTRIAFRGQVGTGPIDIWTVSAQGTDAHPVSTDDQTDGSPSWSPDGRWIVWRRAVGGDQRLWVMTPDGTERHQLPIGETGEELESPIWAPTP